MNASVRSLGLISVAMLSVALVVVQLWHSPAAAQQKLETQRKPERARWEYKFIEGSDFMDLAPPKGENDSDEAMERALNKFGADGWELVQIVKGSGISWVVLKRIRQ